MQRYEMFIDGESRKAAGGEWFPTDNPCLGTPWAEIAQGTEQDVDDAVRAAHRALHSGPWAELTASERGALLRRLGDTIAANARHLAETEVRDNGKLFTEMHGQVGYVPQWFHYYGGLADKVEGTVPPLDKKGYFAYTKKEPVGVVAVITPWNSPLLLLAWKIAPALAAGCTVVIKPSEFTSASTLELVRLFHEAGLPPGVVDVVTGFGRDVGASLVEHPLVRKVTFTGSDATGRHINQAAARDFKHVSLELGGKSPNIVFADADLEAAVNGAVSGIFAATGQTCIAGSRLLVQASVHDEVVGRLIDLAHTGRAREVGSSASYLAEVAPPGRRGFYSSFQYVSIVLGQLAALLVAIVLQNLLTEGQLESWGWRVPFVIGAAAGLVVMCLRRTMEESQHFQQEKAKAATAQERKGLYSLFTEYPRQLLAVFGLAIGGTVAFYTYTTCLQKYLVNTAGIPKSAVSVIGFAALFVYMLLQPVAGALSDRYGRRPIMFAFSICGMLLTVPIMTVLGHTSSPWLAFLLMTAALTFLSGYSALAAIIKAEMFPTKVRALGVGLPHALVTATFGGLTEPIALALKKGGHETVFFWYVTACIGLTFLATLVVREPSRTSLLESPTPAPQATAPLT